MSLTREQLVAGSEWAGDCLLWGGYTLPNGYGMKGGEYVHRRSYELAHGPIPAGRVIDHLCHDPKVCAGGHGCPHRRCVNPEHLRAATHLENTRRSTWTARTHCDHGHEFTEENTGRQSTGTRYCRACRVGRPSTPLDPTHALVRTWAAANGLSFGERGPVSATLRAAYLTAQERVA